MKYNFTVIAFYTTQYKIYTNYAKQFIASVINTGLNYDVKSIESKGNWQENTMYKREFIQETLEKLKSPILYIDIDAIVKAPLLYFSHINCDVACSIQNFPHRQNEMLGGTIFMRYSERVLSFLRQWETFNSMYQGKLEQANMQHAVNHCMVNEGLIFENLSPSYCYITDLTRRAYPDIVPKIEHYQASRTIRQIEQP